MTRPAPVVVTDGDPRHGVVRFSRELAAAVARHPAHRLATDAVHVHFTDRAWGDSPADAARRVRAVAGGRRLTITMHDVPQRSDGPGRLERRIDGYRSLVRASSGVACNSRHEAALLREMGVLTNTDPDPEVIPLPVMPHPIRTTRRPRRRETTVLGFIYPGKGHAEAILAAAEHAPPAAVRALGAAAPGHDGEVAVLRELAAGRGVEFTATGWLSEAKLQRACATAGAPLAAHTHISASGSINSWIAARRRPLVADSRYAREMDALRPGTLQRYPQGRLGDALVRALADPESTWLAPGTETRPHLDDVAGAYLAWWARC